jgi:F-type H+-transporting ATPase subunit delta
MIVASVARRYARALLALAGEQGAIEPLRVELRSFVALQRQQGELARVVANPSFSLHSRRAILVGVVEKMQLSKTLRSTLLLLLDRGKLELIADITRQYERMADERLGRVRAKVTSAAPIEASSLAAIVQALERRTGRQVLVETSVDPSMIDGVVAQVGDVLYDASLKTRLAQLRRNLIHP